MWKFCSEDSNTIVLHDNIITRWQAGNPICLFLDEGFDVAASNSKNSTGRHQYTGEAVMELYDGKLLQVYDEDKRQEQKVLEGEEKEVLNYLLDFEILEFEWQAENKKYILKGILENRAYSELIFSCSKVVYCWNELLGDSWFQGLTTS